MGTTELFVELVVIGIGAFSWIILLTFSILGYQWVPIEQVFSVTALFPLLSFIYIVGIITDRLADVIFSELWALNILKKYYPSVEKAIDDRRLIYSSNEYLANLMEYGRSRLRIARGWAFNSVLNLIAFNLFVLSQVSNDVLRTQLLVWGNSMIGLLAILSWYSWFELTKAQYQRTKGDADFLRHEDRTKKIQKRK